MDADPVLAPRSRSDLSHEASCGSRSYAGPSRSESFAEIREKDGVTREKDGVTRVSVYFRAKMHEYTIDPIGA